MAKTGSRARRESVKGRPVETADIRRAISLHRAGKFDRAKRLYRRILKAEPDHVDALHFSGVLHFQLGHNEEAIRRIERALVLDPDYSDACNNLGNILKETGRLHAAVRAYRRVVELNPKHADAWNNLGVVLRGQGLHEEAERAYAQSIEADPSHSTAWQNLGNLLARMDRLDEAVSAYLKVLNLRPHDTLAYDALGKALYRDDRVDEAVKVYEDWLRVDPDNSVARHMLAACSGEATPQRASDAYVRDLFDSFAGTFDRVLDGLGYQAPALISGLLDRILPVDDAQLVVVDAGCGTGLCAEFLRPRARRLIGVDLSAGMLTRAGTRKLYDQLVEGEMSEWLGRGHELFDLIVSADALCYFGALEQVLSAAAQALQPAGRLVFTLEKASDGIDAYRLDYSGRYSHTEHYVRACLAGAGFDEVNVATVVLRQERADDVAGLLVNART